MSWLNYWKQQARHLKREAYTLYMACRDPRLPWMVRLLALCVAGYAFSPIDLIPDWIPIIGYLDDLIIVPLGIAVVIKCIPPSILQDNRQKAQALLDQAKPVSLVAAACILAIWAIGIWFSISFIYHRMK